MRASQERAPGPDISVSTSSAARAKASRRPPRLPSSSRARVSSRLREQLAVRAPARSGPPRARAAAGSAACTPRARGGRSPRRRAPRCAGWSGCATSAARPGAGGDPQGIDRSTRQCLGEGAGALEGDPSFGRDRQRPDHLPRLAADSSHRSESATSRAIMFQANCPIGSSHHAVAQLLQCRPGQRRRRRPSCRVIVAAIDCSTSIRATQHRVQVEVVARPSGRVCSTSDTKRRRSTRRWHQANSIIASQVAGRDAVGDRLDGPQDRALVTAVGERGSLGREQPERVARAVGAQPVLERGDGLRRAPRANPRPSRAAAAAAPGERRARTDEQHLAHQPVHLEVPRTARSG